MNLKQTTGLLSPALSRRDPADTLKRAALSFLALLCTASAAQSAEVTVELKDTAEKRIVEGTLDFYRIQNSEFHKVGTHKTRANGVVAVTLDDGPHVVVSKHYEIQGELNEKFTATFYPGASYFEVSGKSQTVSLQTARLRIKDAQIVPLNLFATYEDDKLKTSRLALVEGHTGRMIELHGAPTASLELAFPRNAVGWHGMHTYTPTAFSFFDDNTLEVDTYYYNGDVKWSHDVIMLGTRMLNDHQNRLVIKDVKKKSGVEVPFEPMMTTLEGNTLTRVVANISFVSSEKKQPASVLFTYRYIDDPATVPSVPAVVSMLPAGLLKAEQVVLPK